MRNKLFKAWWTQIVKNQWLCQNFKGSLVFSQKKRPQKI